MTPAGIEPATFRFVAQHLNHCATAVPVYSCTKNKSYTPVLFYNIQHRTHVSRLQLAHNDIESYTFLHKTALHSVFIDVEKGR